jgi:hypothetical protein
VCAFSTSTPRARDSSSDSGRSDIARVGQVA